jgi:hypothetical protein
MNLYGAVASVADGTSETELVAGPASPPTEAHSLNAPVQGEAYLYLLVSFVHVTGFLCLRPADGGCQ